MREVKIDWSKHEVIEEINDTAKIWRLKKPDTACQSVNFINIEGVLLVTGDYGRWTFCREFEPGGEDVSHDYWLAKLRINSTQEAGFFDVEYLKEELNDTIQSLIEDYDGNYDNSNFQEELQFFQDLKGFDDIEAEYISSINHAKPNSLDWERIPNGKRLDSRLEVIFQAFNEINRRIKS